MLLINPPLPPQKKKDVKKIIKAIPSFFPAKVSPLDVQGAIRPGCVHLAIEFTMPSAAALSESSESSFGRKIIAAAHSQDDMPWCKFDTDMFLPSSTIKVKQDQGAARSPSPFP